MLLQFQHSLSAQAKLVIVAELFLDHYDQEIEAAMPFF